MKQLVGFGRAGSRAATALAMAVVIGTMAGCSGSTSTSGNGGTPPPPNPPAPPAPTLDLSANPTSISSGGTSTLNWSSTNTAGCTASGAWSGDKATSGSQSTGALTNTSTFTLSCTGGGGNISRSTTVTVPAAATGSASLSWVAPTTYEDGSPIAPADLSGYRIYRGTSATNLQFVASVAANQQTYTVNNLAPGTHYFAVTATTPVAESVYSNVGSKTIP